MEEKINQELQAHLQIIKIILNESNQNLKKACQLAITTLKVGKKILIFGNGGSAADAQHIAAELVGSYKSVRRGLAAIALTTDTSALTAISNDFGYDFVFVRQIEALANKGDLVIGLSTSGNSKNIIKALKFAKKIGCSTLGLSGNKGEIMNDICDINLIVPSDDTPRIQEMHILYGHVICQMIDDNLS